MRDFTSGLKPLSGTVSELTAPLARKRGFASGAIIADWPLIVGGVIAAASLPERIAYGGDGRTQAVLHLRVADGGTALEVQHLSPLIIERINAYFGYAAVARLKLIQGPVPRRPAPPLAREPAPLDHASERRLADWLADVEDPELRERLEALGRAVLGRTPGGAG